MKIEESSAGIGIVESMKYNVIMHLIQKNYLSSIIVYAQQCISYPKHICIYIYMQSKVHFSMHPSNIIIINQERDYEIFGIF